MSEPLTKMVYEIIVGESASLAKEKFLIVSTSLLFAVQQAETKRTGNPKLYSGWVIISAKEIGELIKT